MVLARTATSEGGRQEGARVNTSQDRTRLLLSNAAAVMVGRVCVICANLLLVRLFIEATGSELFGMWAACSQIVAYGMVLDLGVGLGLQNSISHATSRRKIESVAGVASQVTFVLSGMSIGGILTFLFLARLHPGSLVWIFGRGLSPGQETQGLFLIGLAVLSVALQIPLQIPGRIAAGLQLMLRPSLSQGFAALLGVACFPLLIVMGLSPIYALASAVLLPIIVPAIIARQVLMTAGITWPSTRIATKTFFPRVLGIGTIILVSQVSAVVIFQTDIIIVSTFHGPGAAGQYAICARILSIPVLVQAMFLGALWPAFGQSWAAHDDSWLQSTYFRALVATVGVLLPLVVVLALFSGELAKLWTGRTSFHPETRLVWSYALFSLSSLWAGLHATVLNAVGKVRAPALIAAVQAMVNLVAVLSVASRGVWAIALASGIVALATNSIPLYLHCRWAMNERRILQHE